MALLSTALLLQAAPDAAQPSPLGMLVPFAAVGLIMYVFIFRPQQRRQREHDEILKRLERGDRVVTAGGVHGTVVGLTDDVLTLEIATLGKDRVRVKVDRARIERLLEKGKGGESAS